ncbi:hypothetical protein HK100_010803 [Physocladia obscura]|uniref:Uncharacterized protein n=1 Tax=Physocladia obscura TaxID=109957 RepID=A0AAD5TAG7_9FUNG|nr:hypothetical protein HK100_010803 [Physocladia obscura]
MILTEKAGELVKELLEDVELNVVEDKVVLVAVIDARDLEDIVVEAIIVDVLLAKVNDNLALISVDNVVKNILFDIDRVDLLILLAIVSGTTKFATFGSLIVEALILLEIFEVVGVEELKNIFEVAAVETLDDVCKKVGFVNINNSLVDNTEVLDAVRIGTLLVQEVFVNDKLPMLEELENELLLDGVFGTTMLAAFESLLETFKFFKDVEEVNGFVNFTVAKVVAKLMDDADVRDCCSLFLSTVKLVDKVLIVAELVVELFANTVESIPVHVVVFVDNKMTMLEELKNELLLEAVFETAILAVFEISFLTEETFKFFKDVEEVHCFVRLDAFEVTAILVDNVAVRDGDERLLPTVMLVDKVILKAKLVSKLLFDTVELKLVLIQEVFVDGTLIMFTERVNEILLEVVFGTAMLTAFESLPVEELILLKIVDVVAVEKLDDCKKSYIR